MKESRAPSVPPRMGDLGHHVGGLHGGFGQLDDVGMGRYLAVHVAVVVHYFQGDARLGCVSEATRSLSWALRAAKQSSSKSRMI
jgi:hypothetical protein